MHLLYFLGAGKVFKGLGADLSNRGVNTIAFTTKAIENTHQEFIQPYDDEGEFLGYPALFIADNEKFTEITSLFRPDVKIYIVNISAHKTLLNHCRDMVMLSGCKEGLLSTYAPILNEHDCNGRIVCIDNDKTIATRANYAIKNFTVNSSVIDMYCPKLPEYQNGIMRVYVRRTASLTFAPDCDVFKEFFRPTFSSSLIVRFSKSYREYETAKKEKLYNVNIPHTIMATQALDYFIHTKNENPETFSNEIKFSDIPLDEYEKMKKYCLKCHRKYCMPWVKKRARRYNEVSDTLEQLDVYSKVASSCIADLYKSGDTITRIIDPSSVKSLAKMKSHIVYVIDFCPDRKFLDTMISELTLHSQVR